MGLSVEKLEKLLRELGCSCTNYYTYRDYLRYIECINLKTKDIFLVFIDDQYKFKLDNIEKTFQLKRIRDDEIFQIMEDYSKEEDKLEISKIYSNNVINTNIDNEPKVMEETLEEGYNISIDLKNKNDEKFSIRDIRRQCRRLRMSIEGSKYRLCIISNNYMVITRKDDDVIFQIKSKESDKERRVYIILDIETIMTDSQMLQNINRVYGSFIEILNKNIIINKTKLEEFKEADIGMSSVIDIVEKINRYSEYINKMDDIIIKKDQEEYQILEQIKSIKNKPKYGLTQDLKDAPVMIELDEKIRKLREDKNGYIQQILDLKKRQQNNTLLLDRILFDNIMLLSTLKYNLSEIKFIK
jgi:hypothetical protein